MDKKQKPPVKMGETPFSMDFSGLSEKQLIAEYWESVEQDDCGHAFAAMDCIEIRRLLGYTPKRSDGEG